MSSRVNMLKPREIRYFISPEAISQHLKCPVCQDVFDDPVRIQCGHTFCYICIVQWSNFKQDCPKCRQPMDRRGFEERDLLARNIIDDLEVKCLHSGCSWIGTEGIRKKHQRCCQFKPRNSVIISPKAKIIDVNDFDQDVEIVEKPIKPMKIHDVEEVEIIQGPVTIIEVEGKEERHVELDLAN